MGTLDSSSTDRERRLDEAAAEYFAARAAGSSPIASNGWQNSRIWPRIWPSSCRIWTAYSKR